MTKRFGRFQVTPELLMQALCIPDGTVLHATRWDRFTYGGSFEVIVESQDLTEVAEGEEAPIYVPTLSHHDDGSITWDWGDPLL